jgi:hypothetical protein
LICRTFSVDSLLESPATACDAANMVLSMAIADSRRFIEFPSIRLRSNARLLQRAEVSLEVCRMPPWRQEGENVNRCRF